MRAIIPRSLMQMSSQEIDGDALVVTATIDCLESSSSSPKQQVDNDHTENQANAATTVVTDSGAHVVAATAEEN
jgi:hypothetical protein